MRKVNYFIILSLLLFFTACRAGKKPQISENKPVAIMSMPTNEGAYFQPDPLPKNTRSGITIFCHQVDKSMMDSPVELLITDPLGRKAGYDPVTNTFYHDQIPYAGYGESGLPSLPEDPPEPQGRELGIAVAPAQGEYELKVIGTNEGVYELEIYALDREGGESSRIFENVPIAPNQTHTYILNYSQEPGSQIQAQKQNP